MDDYRLKNQLIEALGKVYYMEAFSQLVEFLQGELYVLYYLAGSDEMETSPSEISEKLHMSRPRTTATLTALRKKGFVVTRSNEKDRRRVDVMITGKGKEHLEMKKDAVNHNLDLFIEGIGSEEALHLIRIINKAAGLMETERSN
ncbi:MarR family winged helix-turn-helix transcriptional regulator [Gudongella sp. SC589]|uniref:MarR family winged helix-turn-helix transcriptional regulator n=1 Tax=Gudongella sp. SC589 TaxID=3385990 RepID=UPI0039047758